MPQHPMICLGSASPRRAELLRQIGVSFMVQTADVDESVHDNEAPELYVLRLAVAKARAVLSNQGDAAKLPVLGADTTVVLDGEILGKPQDEADGLAMLARLSGRTHQVYTAVALVEPGAEGREAGRLSVSRVRFSPTSAQQRQAYWNTGEPCDKAGGYGIQGHAAAFIEHLDGSFSGVMGLPLHETADLLLEFGIDVYGSWES